MADALAPAYEDVLAAWRARVVGDRAQVDRVREAEDGPDFYGPVAASFKADPHRSDEPVLDILRGLVQPGETWLDIGAGGGRYALPLALRAGEVIAVDPSPGMLGVLREGMDEHGIANVRIVEGRWPDAGPIAADVALIAHVGNDIAEIGPFVEAMEASARRLCVAVMLERPPASAFWDVFEAVHGEPRTRLPSLPEFLTLLLARGRMFELRLSARGVMAYPSPEEAITVARRQTWTAPGSEKDLRMQAFVRERLQERNGRYAFSWAPLRIGVATWEPR